MIPSVLFEDNHLLIVDKPAGWVVQGAATGDRSLFAAAKEYLKKKYAKPGKVYLGIVNRLDRVVTGVLPLARTSKAASRLSEQFRLRSVEKIYWAVVTGKATQATATLRHWLTRDEIKGKTLCHQHPMERSQEGCLRYRLLQEWGRFSLLEIELETGRKHQIRAQLASVGLPIVGDAKYGSPIVWEDQIALHCRRLSLDHPTTKQRMSWEAGLPPRWNELCVPAANLALGKEAE